MTQLMLIRTQTDGLVELAGDLTFATINKKTVELCDFQQFNTEVRIDFSQINNSDSAGLALVIEWIKCSQIKGCRLILCHFPPPLQTLATLCGFDLQPYLMDSVPTKN